jgi:hypothetical protein
MIFWKMLLKIIYIKRKRGTSEEFGDFVFVLICEILAQAGDKCWVRCFNIVPTQNITDKLIISNRKQKTQYVVNPVRCNSHTLWDTNPGRKFANITDKVIINNSEMIMKSIPLEVLETTRKASTLRETELPSSVFSVSVVFTIQMQKLNQIIYQ